MSEKKKPLWLVSYRYRGVTGTPARDVVETISQHPGEFFAGLTLNGHNVERIYSATWIPDNLKDEVSSVL